MRAPTLRSERDAAIWSLVEAQHGVIARRQLEALGVTAGAIKRRLQNGRLHPLWRGVYAVGRPQLDIRGMWMAAVLCCGPDGVLSHASAAALWGLRPEARLFEVTVPARIARSHPSIKCHRCDLSPETHRIHDGIPVTEPALTIVDMAARLSFRSLEAMVNEADKLDRIDPDALRQALRRFRGRRGVARLRSVLDRHHFALTDSELERRFLPIAQAAGLPLPQTGVWVSGFKVDFFWPALGLVVETDGLRYHRTPAQQARDRLRDQAHTAAGLTQLRFTHAQIRHQPQQVKTTLTKTAKRLVPPGRVKT